MRTSTPLRPTPGARGSLLSFLLAAAAIPCIPVGDCAAQDSNYWDQNYGTESLLLGGLVIGAVRDMSATYYNPGALALMENPGFLFSARVFEYSVLTVEDANPDGSSVNDSGLQPAPAFVTGSFKFAWTGNQNFSYVFLVRERFNLRIPGPVVDPPGAAAADSIASVTVDRFLDQSLGEYWGGVSWSRQLGKRFGLGISPFVAVRNQSSRRHITIETLTDGGDLAFALRTRDFSFWNWRVLAKAGLTYEADRWSAGVTVTTPSANLFGKGSSFVSLALSVPDSTSGAPETVEYASDHQTDADSNYRSSWAVGLGAAYSWPNTSLYFSTEWFDSKSTYSVLDTSPFTSQLGGETLPNEVTQELASVVNYGLGASHRFGEKVSGYASFITDHSSNPSTADSNLSLTSWDLYHVAVGSMFEIHRSSVTFGLSYTFGGQTGSGLVPGGAGEDGPQDLAGRRDVRYRRLNVIVGFSLDLIAG